MQELNTSYKIKYLKYKKKYFSLKNSNLVDNTGGSSYIDLESTKSLPGPKYLNLSGPNIISYINIGKYEKKIILIGDMHNIKNKCNGKDIKLEDHIKNLFENNSLTNFDLFIEFPYNEVKKLGGDISIIENRDTEDYMHSIRKLGLENYKKNPNKRVHFSDIRDDDLATNLQHKSKVLNKILKTVKPIDPSLDYKDLIFEFHNFVVENIYQDYGAINDYINDKTDEFKLNSKILNKELKGLETIIGKENIKKVLTSVKIRIEQLFDILFDDKDIILFDNIGNIEFQIIDCFTLISELYTFARIFKSDFNNIIVFEGESHIYMLSEFFKIIESEFIYHYISYPHKPQCVQAIPFDKFFLDV